MVLVSAVLVGAYGGLVLAAYLRCGALVAAVVVVGLVSLVVGVPVVYVVRAALVGLWLASVVLIVGGWFRVWSIW